jgi:hypothetical protein
MIATNHKFDQFTRCCFGGGIPEPKAPPKPPAPTEAGQNMLSREANLRRQRARGFQSTILTGGLGVTKPSGTFGQPKSLLGE